MAAELTETPSPQPSPDIPGPEVRMSRLHEALKQLKAKGTVPLSAVRAELAQEPVSAAASPRPAASPALPRELIAEPARPAALAVLPSVGNAVQAGPVADLPRIPAMPAPAEQSVTQEILRAPPAAPPVAVHQILSPPIAQESPSAFSLDDWYPATRLQPFRRWAEQIAVQFTSGASAALALAAADPRHDLTSIASRLALCLAERNDGDVLLIESDLSTRRLTRGATLWGLVDLAAGRVELSQAIVPTEAARLSLLGAQPSVVQEDAPLSEQWRSTMKQIKQRFRFVVATAEPNFCSSPDPWLTSFDAIYLVAAVNQPIDESALAAIAKLESAGAALSGCVALV